MLNSVHRPRPFEFRPRPFAMGSISLSLLSMVIASSSGCPVCNNGGVCLSSTKDGQLVEACFCPYPFNGPDCSGRVATGRLASAPLSDEDVSNSVPRTFAFRPSTARLTRRLDRDEAQIHQLWSDVSMPEDAVAESRDDASGTASSGDAAISVNPHPVTRSYFLKRTQGPAPELLCNLVLTEPNPLISDPTQTRLVVYMSLCPKNPCELGLFLEDVYMLDSVGNTIKFKIVPSEPTVSITDVEEELDKQIQTEGSKLRQTFSSIDKKESDAWIEGEVPAAAPAETSAPTEKPEPVTKKPEPTTLKPTTTPAIEEKAVPIPHPMELVQGGPMSTTIRCIIILAIQFFVIASGLFIVQTANIYLSSSGGTLQGVLRRAKQTVFLAPIVCVFLIILRMRALQLTEGTGNVQLWAQVCMQLIAATITVQALAVLIKPLFLVPISRQQQERSALGSLFYAIAVVLNIVEITSTFILFAGFITLFVALFTMTPETCTEGEWARDKSFLAHLRSKEVESMPAAMTASVILIIQFVSVYFLLRTVQGLRRRDGVMPKWYQDISGALHLARMTVNLAPMLCILFIVARARALHISPRNDFTPMWVQVCMYVCAWGVFGQICIIFLGLVLGTGSPAGTDRAEADPNPGLRTLLERLRYLLLLVVCGSFILVIFMVTAFKNPEGPTPSSTKADFAIFCLVVQYFGIYLCMLIVQSLRDVLVFPLALLTSALEQTTSAVEFCPMLSVLFMAASLRAQELVVGGQPQGWAGDAMFLATAAITALIILCLLMPFFIPYERFAELEARDVRREIRQEETELNQVAGETPATARSTDDPKQFTFSMLLMHTLQILGMIGLHSMIAVVCFSVVVIETPAANGEGGLQPDGDPSNNYFPRTAPMSTTMQCVVYFLMMFFSIKGFCFITREIAIYHGGRGKLLFAIFERAGEAVEFAPMLAILFLAVRMRALHLTHGQGNPPMWVQECMRITVLAILVQVVTILIVPVFSGEALGDDEVGVSEEDERRSSPWLRCFARILTVVDFLAAASMFAAMFAICHAGFFMTPEDCMEGEVKSESLWGKDGPPAVPPVLQVVMNLTVQFFTISLAYKFFLTLVMYGVDTPWVRKAKRISMEAQDTVSFAPMVCVLFVGARMRAMQIDPINGAPQAYAQTCFFVVAYAILWKTLLVLARGPFMSDPKEHVDDESQSVMSFLSFLSGLGTLVLYTGVGVVVYSIFTIRGIDGGPAPPLAPYLNNIMILTLQFFVVYLIISCAINPAIRERLHALQDAVLLNPMLGVFLLGIRLRAVELAGRNGAPPVWVQDTMYRATSAIFAQLIMMVLLAVVSREEQKTEGSEDATSGLALLGSLFQVIRFLVLAWLYGAVSLLMVGLFLMTPVNCNPASPSSKVGKSDTII